MNTTLPYRLPLSVTPDDYTITLSLDKLPDTTYQGVIQLNITVHVETTCIVLHQSELTILAQDVVLHQPGGPYITAESIDLDNIRQFAIISFKDPIKLGTASLIVAFTSTINTKNATGFFQSSTDIDVDEMSDEEATQAMAYYSGTSNKPREKKQKRASSSEYMYATQFEAIYARMAFPCFDEPAMKAHMQAIIRVPTNYTALFNTKEQEIRKVAGTTTFIFEKSPMPMSVYLVAFAIGKFEYIEHQTKDIRYRLYAPAGGYAKKLGAFGLASTVGCIEYFTPLYSPIPWSPMKKLDAIAVPAIVDDAMENWGLVTYATDFLLTDPKKPNLAQIQLIAQVTCHELSHQWFGDTVTMPWWSEVYLHEGFARYLQFTSVKSLHPTWDIYSLDSPLSFFNFAFFSGMEIDYKGISHALSVPEKDVLGSQSSAQNGFSNIAYGKGAAINKYIVETKGEAAWNKALTHHLELHKYTNPTVDDLLDSFQHVMGGTTKQDLSTWMYQRGFPVVTISTVSKTSVMISQSPISKYLEGQTWWVNMTLQIGELGAPSTEYKSIELRKDPITVKINEDADLIIGNYNWSAYLLTNYSPDLWDSIFGDLENRNVVQNKLLIRQMFFLLKTGHVDVETVVQLTNVVTTLYDVELWSLLVSQWASVHPLLIETPSFPYYARIITTAFKPMMNHKNTPESLLSEIYYWDVYFGTDAIIKEVSAMFWKEQSGGSKIPEVYQKAAYLAVSMYNSTSIPVLHSLFLKNHNTDVLNAMLLSSECSFISTVVGNLKLDERITAEGVSISLNSVCRRNIWINALKDINTLLTSTDLLLVNTAKSDAQDVFINAVAGKFWYSLIFLTLH